MPQISHMAYSDQSFMEKNSKLSP